jgi:hypothetical protein
MTLPFRPVTIAVLLTAIFAVLPVYGESSDLPTEVDTFIVGHAVTLTKIQGEILKKGENNSLIPVTDDMSLKLGEMILVRKGASFSIEDDQFGPENHGDRWIRFQ